MDEYSKIIYAFNNALGNFVVMHLHIEFKEKYAILQINMFMKVIAVTVNAVTVIVVSTGSSIIPSAQ